MKPCKQLIQLGVAVPCLFLVGACSRVPITGRVQLAFQNQQAPETQDESLALARKAGAVDYDHRIQNRLHRIARRLVPAVAYFDRYRHATGWSAHMVLGEVPDDWAQARGRRIYVTSSLAEMDLDDAELAAVLAHEAGHLIANHVPEKATAIDLCSMLLGFRPDKLPSNLLEDILWTMVMPGVDLFYLNPLERTQELEADRIGLYILAQAGYDPHAMIRLLKKLARRNPNPPVLAIWSSHPTDAARIAQVEKLMPEVMPVYHDIATHA